MELNTIKCRSCNDGIMNTVQLGEGENVLICNNCGTDAGNDLTAEVETLEEYYNGLSDEEITNLRDYLMVFERANSDSSMSIKFVMNSRGKLVTKNDYTTSSQEVSRMALALRSNPELKNFFFVTMEDDIKLWKKMTLAIENAVDGRELSTQFAIKTISTANPPEIPIFTDWWEVVRLVP